MFYPKQLKQFNFTFDPIRKNKIRSFLGNLNLHNRKIKKNLQTAEDF